MKNEVRQPESQSVHSPDGIIADHEYRDEWTVEPRCGAVQPRSIEIAKDELRMVDGLSQPGEMYKIVTIEKIEKDRRITGKSNDGNPSHKPNLQR